MNGNIILDERLAAAAELVPANSILLDVGTDHGYLPVHLLLSGKILHAGASDINEDPLSKSVKTAGRYGVSDKMSFYLSDGLADVPDIEKYTAVSICGMGGELIARIISDSAYLREKCIPLVLQPMSSVEDLSKYLSSCGFSIKDERIAFAAGKIYRVILAVYDGVAYELSPVDHLLGKVNIKRGRDQENFSLLLRKNILKYTKIIKGKKQGGIKCDYDAAILDELIRIAKTEDVEYENI